MTRAAVFDLGGVLEVVDDDRWQEEWAARWEDRAARPRGALLDGADRATRDALDAGTITETQSRAWFAGALGLSPASADEMLADMWDRYCGELDVELRDFVVELGSSMRTAVLSNSVDGARREDERRYEFAAVFDDLVYSHEVGIAKPDPAIFRLTERRLDVRPQEVVFLDDRVEHVEAAHRCGWHAVHHVTTSASVAAIREIITARAR